MPQDKNALMNQTSQLHQTQNERRPSRSETSTLPMALSVAPLWLLSRLCLPATWQALCHVHLQTQQSSEEWPGHYYPRYESQRSWGRRCGALHLWLTTGRPQRDQPARAAGTHGEQPRTNTPSTVLYSSMGRQQHKYSRAPAPTEQFGPATTPQPTRPWRH